MRIMFGMLLLLGFCTGTVAGQAQGAEGGGIVSGNGIGVVVSAPAGWSFDTRSGAAQGLRAVMYPAGANWAEAPAVMYLNLVSLAEGETLEAFVAADVARFRERSPVLVVANAAPIAQKDGKTALVRHFSDSAAGSFEAIAYVAQAQAVAVYVLSSRDQANFARYLPEFNAMVGGSFINPAPVAKPGASQPLLPAAAK